MSPPAGIPPGEYRRRRRALARAAGDDAAVLVPAAPVRYRNGDAAYPYRQSSDLLYLAGFEEPEALLVLVPGRAGGEEILFCRERDPRAERYDGARVGPEAAAACVGVDDAFPIADADEIVPGLLEGRRRVLLSIGADPDFDQRALGWLAGLAGAVRPGEPAVGELADLGHLLHDMRLVKSPAELRLMREAARITGEGHRRAMAAAGDGVPEALLEAELFHAFRSGGARGPAYESIVAGGARACVLHYVRNDARLADGELVLVDAGCEYAGYAADVTRTFPVGGTFSPPQREIYRIVLAAHRAAIAAVRPGADFDAPHRAATAALTDGLIELGVLVGEREALLAEEAVRRFSLHRSSHWLGLDVHDVGDYRLAGAWRDLVPGMVLTVEPGLYFPPEDPHVPARWRGIGVRIEDDVVVTADGAEVLATHCPVEIDAIETLLARRSEPA